jgi:cytochrome c6
MRQERRKCIVKKFLVVSILAMSVVLLGVACRAEKADRGISGEALFNQHCAVCHPDGGNIINPAFTLHKKDLQAHNITKPGDIIEKMRNPGAGMTKFDKDTISDKDAGEIADYILKTFK